MHQSWLRCHPSSKLCIQHIDPRNLYLIGIAFKIHHAIRNDYEELLQVAVANQDFSEIILKATFLANLFAFEYTLTLAQSDLVTGAPVAQDVANFLGPGRPPLGSLPACRQIRRQNRHQAWRALR